MSAAEVERNLAECSPDVRAIIERWRRDLAFTPPEAVDWRWSIIAGELDGRFREVRQHDHSPVEGCEACLAAEAENGQTRSET